jgi:branched-chain amino acid aminotransferase
MKKMYEIIVPGSLGDFDGIAWCNGKLVPWRDISLHPMAHGLHYASAVFEGIRVYNGRAFQAVEHMERFQEGAKEMLMHLPYSSRDMAEAAQRIVDEHKIGTGYIRPIAWRGAGPIDFDPTPNPANVAIFAWSLGDFIPQGAKLVLSQWERPSSNTGPWHIKAAGNYTAATLQKSRAKSMGYSDALFLDWQKNVADVTGANIFLVIDGELHTPEPDGFFAGMTRQSVIAFAKADRVKVVIRKIPPSDLRRAQEVFLTGSAAGIVSVGLIDLLDGRPITYEPDGRCTKRLQAQYAEMVKSNTLQLQ